MYDISGRRKPTGILADMYQIKYSTDMELSEIFKRLALPKHADRAYLSLESGGPSTVAALSKRIRVHRPAVYRALTALEREHLVTRRRFGGRVFISASPREAIALRFAGVQEAVRTTSSEKPLTESFGAIRYLEGERSVAAIFTDLTAHAKRGDTFYRYTSERDLDQVNALLPSDYRTRRDAKRLERLVISNPESGSRKKSRLERFIKFLGSDKESFRQNAIQLIYGSRVAFIDLNTYRGFIIENETLADFQKTIFRALYKRL